MNCNKRPSEMRCLDKVFFALKIKIVKFLSARDFLPRAKNLKCSWEKRRGNQQPPAIFELKVFRTQKGNISNFMGRGEMNCLDLKFIPMNCRIFATKATTDRGLKRAKLARKRSHINFSPCSPSYPQKMTQKLGWAPLSSAQHVRPQHRCLFVTPCKRRFSLFKPNLFPTYADNARETSIT